MIIVKLTVREAKMARAELGHAAAAVLGEKSAILSIIADALYEAETAWAEGMVDPAIITIQITDKPTL